MSKKDEPKQQPVRQLANEPPTLQAANELQTAFEYFNSHLFSGELPHMMVSFEVHKKALGVFRPKRFTHHKGQTQVDWITLNPEHFNRRDLKETLSTLVHEMVHAWVEYSGKGKVKPWHCKNWCERMIAIGLEPIIVDGKGNPVEKPTGRNATHRILPFGKFSEAADKLIAKGFSISWHLIPEPKKPKKAGKVQKMKVKYMCPSCQEKAWARPDAQINCTPCGVAYECQEVADVGGEDEQAAEDKKFTRWMEKVDEILLEQVNLASADLEDFTWMAEFEAGSKPEEAVDQYLEEHGLVMRK